MVHVPQFYATGGLTLYGFFLFYEHVRNPVGRICRALLDLSPAVVSMFESRSRPRGQR
jgi:hypothetical protein